MAKCSRGCSSSTTTGTGLSRTSPQRAGSALFPYAASELIAGDLDGDVDADILVFNSAGGTAVQAFANDRVWRYHPVLSPGATLAPGLRSCAAGGPRWRRRPGSHPLLRRQDSPLVERRGNPVCRGDWPRWADVRYWRRQRGSAGRFSRQHDPGARSHRRGPQGFRPAGRAVLRSTVVPQGLAALESIAAYPAQPGRSERARRAKRRRGIRRQRPAARAHRVRRKVRGLLLPDPGAQALVRGRLSRTPQTRCEGRAIEHGRRGCGRRGGAGSAAVPRPGGERPRGRGAHFDAPLLWACRRDRRRLRARSLARRLCSRSKRA
jgi:hypothetical protein